MAEPTLARPGSPGSATPLINRLPGGPRREDLVRMALGAVRSACLTTEGTSRPKLDV